MIGRNTCQFNRRSKSFSGITKTTGFGKSLNTHKRVFGDLNASMAGVYGEDGLRDCAGKKSGLQERNSVTPSGKDYGFDGSMNTSYKPARR